MAKPPTENIYFVLVCIIGVVLAWAGLGIIIVWRVVG